MKNVGKKKSLRCIIQIILALLIFIGFASLVTGCALSKTILYPINKSDFWIDDDGNIVMSEFYFKEVLKVKLDLSRLPDDPEPVE